MGKFVVNIHVADLDDRSNKIDLAEEVEAEYLLQALGIVMARASVVPQAIQGVFKMIRDPFRSEG